MPETVLKLDERDNAVVALTNLEVGTEVRFGAASSPASCIVAQSIPAKHKMALSDLRPGDLIYLYGMVVGEAVEVRSDAPFPTRAVLFRLIARAETSSALARYLP